MLSQSRRPSLIKDTPSLIEAITNGNVGDEIFIASGIFELPAPLIPKAGMKIMGAKDHQTVITATDSWQPTTDNLPQEEDPTAYLFRLEEISDVVIDNVKLTGKNLHGAIYAKKTSHLKLEHILFENFLWSSVRTFGLDHFQVHDNVFIDAGRKYGATTGAALYINSTNDAEFWDNKIYSLASEDNSFFGFKGRKATNLRFHHNDVQVNFSLEFPFENDLGMEIDHNNFTGVVSIPKQNGGIVPADGLTYHIHHNLFHKSYSLEWPRNSVEVDHNLFDCQPDDDSGNLISNFSEAQSPGATKFHDNLISNPGRGIFWTKGIYNQFYFHNNYIKSNILSRTNSFFEFNPLSNFNTIEIKNNIFENIAQNPRPLMGNTESYSAKIENNTLDNISDTDAYANPDIDETRGPLQPLNFQVGSHGEYKINDWKVTPIISKPFSKQ